MASELVFHFDPENNTITIKDGDSQTVPVDPHSGFFIYKDKQYILYKFTTTLVKHQPNGLGSLDTKYFDQLLVIEQDKGKTAVLDIANVTQYQLEIGTKNGTRIGDPNGLMQTLEKIKNNIMENIHNGTATNLDNSLKQIVQMLVGQLKNFNVSSMIKSLPHVVKIKKLYEDTTPCSVILSDLLKYIAYHNTLHDCIVNNRGLSCYPDTIFLLTQINLLMMSHPVKVKNDIIFSTIHSLVIHQVIEIAYNIIVMRLDRELFIKERNQSAKEIKLRFYSLFPILTRTNITVEEILSTVNRDPKFMRMIEEESVQMNPFIALYRQSDKCRIKTCYSECRKNKEIEKTCDSKINWLHPDNFISILQNFATQHSNDYCRYDTDLFLDIIKQFIITEPGSNNTITNHFPIDEPMQE